MSIKNLFYWSYWFSQPYIARGGLAWVWFGGFMLLIFGGIALQVARQYQTDALKKEAARRWVNFLLTMGILGLIWMFFRQERIPVLAWRAWLLAWLAIAAIWKYKIVRYSLKRIPVIRAEQAAREQKEKYLPKK